VGALNSVTFPSPGFLGLNKQKAQVPGTPEWATEAKNAVVDAAGRIAARKGYVNLTATPISGSPAVLALHEYITNSGVTTLIAAANSKLWESTNDGSTWIDRTAALTVSGSKFQFVNFNGKVIACQAGHSLMVKTSGNFALIAATSGTVPVAPVAVLAAYGRLWAIESDLQTVKYCALLDETKWDAADGAGLIDMRQVWTLGTDTAVTVKAFGGRLVVMGKRHVVLWTDGAGAALGLDPENIYVEDVVEGVGTVARDSVQNIGEGDLVFLSQNGVRSLTRVLQEQQTPVADITKNSRQYFNDLLLAPTVDHTETRSVYSPEEGFYLVTVPDANTTLCVDIRQPLEDGTYRITDWPAFIPNSLARRIDGTVLFGWAGTIGKYYGYNDGDSGVYRFVFRSTWLDLGDENAYLKMLKRIKLIAFSPAGVSPTVKWFWDFKRDLFYHTLTYIGDGSDEYGNGDYGTAEYSGVLSQRIDLVPTRGTGQFFMIGVELEVDGQPFAVQSLTAYYQKGRLA
jgi:hypothetical protein